MLQYLITEAVSIKVAHEDHEAQKRAQKEAEAEQWKKEKQRELKDQFSH